MGEVSFTPGPWIALKDRIDSAYCIDTAPGVDSDNGYVIADQICGKRREANAHLIASAPELYEALIIARGEIARVHQLRSALPQIDAALAKARGEPA